MQRKIVKDTDSTVSVIFSLIELYDVSNTFTLETLKGGSGDYIEQSITTLNPSVCNEMLTVSIDYDSDVLLNGSYKFILKRDSDFECSEEVIIITETSEISSAINGVKIIG